MASYIALDSSGWKYLPEGSYSAVALDHEWLGRPCHWYNAVPNPRGLCPVCGETADIIGETTDGRLIGSCKDAFKGEAFMDDCNTDPTPNQMAY